jgi:Na+/H+-dicarboxylate symporter
MPSLNVQIFLGAFVGVIAGWLLGHHTFAPSISVPALLTFEIIGRIFINLLKMTVVPLVFTSMVCGVVNLQGPQAKRIWVTMLGYFTLTTLLASLTGLVAANILKPGANLDIHLFQDKLNAFQSPATLSVMDLITSFINSLLVNPIAAMASGNVLGIITFAILLGIALMVLGSKAATVTKAIQELFDVTMLIVGWIMRLAPLGIMGLLANLVASQNVQLLSTVSQFIFLVLGTTLLHGVVTLPLILWVITRVSPLKFFSAMRESLITAMSTSSSNATLPANLRCVENNLKIDKSIAGFVLPIGATVNMDGTALYEAMAALFVANLCGIQLDLIHQIIVMLTAMLASVGAPGIPSAGMVTMIMVLQAVGLPAEAVAILLPIDRLLDTVRTAVNVEGDAVGACIVQRIVTKKPLEIASNQAKVSHR